VLAPEKSQYVSLVFHHGDLEDQETPLPSSFAAPDDVFMLHDIVQSVIRSVAGVSVPSRPREATVWFPSDRHSRACFAYLGILEGDESTYRAWVTRIAVVRLLLRAFGVRVRVNTLDSATVRFLVAERLGYDAPGTSPEAARARAEVLLAHPGVSPFGLDLIEMELAIPPEQDCISSHAWSFVTGDDATMPSLEHVSDRITDVRRGLYRSFARGLRTAIERQFGGDAILNVLAEQMLERPASDLETAIGRWLFRFLFVAPDSVNIVCANDDAFE